jgi:Domain of unknown function (DUF4440)
LKTSLDVHHASTCNTCFRSRSREEHQNARSSTKGRKGILASNCEECAEAVGRFLADGSIIIDPDGGIIVRATFLGVMKSGALTHEMMASEDTRVRTDGNTAIVTALTTTKGKFSGQAFTTQERVTAVFVR